ncbi:MAG: YDG domain-containing protein, partial [Planctomycetota bacterium]
YTTAGAPAITGITPGNGTLSVAFTAPSSTGGSSITNYKYSTDGGSTWTAVSPAATTSPITITGLANGTSYNVQLRAVNAAGDGTATVSTAATPRTTPSAPTINSITPSNGQLSVAFSPPSDGGSAITGYEYSTNGGSSFTAATGTSSPIVITGLTNGVTYDVQLRAVNAAGTGAASSTTQAAPVAPASPTVTVSGLSGLLTSTYGTASVERTFTVSGSTLSGDLTVTAATGMEVSTTSGASFGDSLVLTRTSGSVASTTVYVRLKATAAAGAYNSRSITIAGGGDDKSVTTEVAGNIVNAKALTITGIAIADKVYDRGTSATITGTAAYSGLVNSESFSVTGTPSASFADKTVANGKAVTVSGYTAPSANYTISQPTGLTASITTAALTVTGAAVTAKTYDGTTAATITGTLSGVIVGDTVSIATSTGTFASANAGTGIAVTAALTLGGADAANYSLTQPSGLTGDITRASQTITFGALSSKTTADASFTLSATASSGLTVTYTSSDPTVASIDGTTVTILKIGTATITASQSGNGNYNAASDVQQTLTVVRALVAGDIAIIDFQTDDPDEFAFVALAPIAGGQSIAFTDNAWDGSALATNENTVIWTAPSGGVAAGTVVTFQNLIGFSVGTYTGSYSGASTSGDQVIAYTGSATNPTFLYAVTSNTWINTGTPSSNTSYLPAGLINGTTARDFTTEVDDQYYNVASISGTKNQILASIGDVNNWSRNNTRYGNFPNASSTFALTQSQTITFGSLSPVTYGDSTFNLTATASSNLGVTYVSSDPTVASISGSTVTILKAGTTTITASQAGGTSGGATYSAAAAVQQTLTVSRKGITVTADGKTKTYGDANPVLTYSITSGSLVGADTLAGVLATSATANSSVSGSPYTITAGTLTDANNPNYSIAFTGANLSVTAKALTVTANNVEKIQGQSLTAGTGSTAFISSGLV